MARNPRTKGPAAAWRRCSRGRATAACCPCRSSLKPPGRILFGVGDPPLDVAGDRLRDRRLARGAVAPNAAVGPFDMAVAGRDPGLGENDQMARHAALAGDRLDGLAD